MSSSHVIEERCEQEEHAAGNTSKQEQLSAEEPSHESNDALPPRLLCRGTQGQRDGQGVGDGIELHVDREAVQQRCPQQVPSCGRVLLGEFDSDLRGTAHAVPVRHSKVASTKAAITDSAFPRLDTPMGRGLSSHREQSRHAD